MLPKMHDIKVVLHDWDDTVVNSFGLVLHHFQSFAQNQDLSIPAQKDLVNVWGSPMRDILHQLWPLNDIDSLEKSFVSYLPADYRLIPFPEYSVRLLI